VSVGPKHSVVERPKPTLSEASRTHVLSFEAFEVGFLGLPEANSFLLCYIEKIHRTPQVRTFLSLWLKILPVFVLPIYERPFWVATDSDVNKSGVVSLPLLSLQPLQVAEVNQKHRIPTRPGHTTHKDLLPCSCFPSHSAESISQSPQVTRRAMNF